jgi:hypothetical protein
MLSMGLVGVSGACARSGRPLLSIEKPPPAMSSEVTSQVRMQ